MKGKGQGKGVVYDHNKIKYDFIRGKTLEEIAQPYGVTRERIRQILAKMGLSGKDGGASVRGRLYKEAKKIKSYLHLERKSKYWGFPDIRSYLLHIKVHGTSSVIESPMHRYIEQKRNVERFNLFKWNMSFCEWWELWESSGHWEERGRGGYMMRVINELKPFEVGNVEIVHIKGSERRNYVLARQEKEKHIDDGPTLFDDYVRELKNL